MRRFGNRDEALRWVRVWARQPDSVTDVGTLLGAAVDGLTWNGELLLEPDDRVRLDDARRLLAADDTEESS